MKITKRKTRSETRSNNSQRAEISIKRKKTAKAVSTQYGIGAISSRDLNVEVEEKEADLKNRLESFGNEEGM